MHNVLPIEHFLKICTDAWRWNRLLQEKNAREPREASHGSVSIRRVSTLIANVRQLSLFDGCGPHEINAAETCWDEGFLSQTVGFPYKFSKTP